MSVTTTSGWCVADRRQHVVEVVAQGDDLDVPLGGGQDLRDPLTDDEAVLGECDADGHGASVDRATVSRGDPEGRHAPPHRRACPAREAGGRRCGHPARAGTVGVQPCMSDAPTLPTAPAPTAEPHRLPRGRRYLVRALLTLAGVLAVLAIIAVWANRQALNADNWASTSSELLDDPVIRAQVAAFVVDEVYANVDVQGEVARGAAAPVPAAGRPRHGCAAHGRGADDEHGPWAVPGSRRRGRRPTGSPRSSSSTSPRASRRRSRPRATPSSSTCASSCSTSSGRLGLPASVVGKIPPGTGRIKILTGDQVSSLQNLVSALRSFAVVLPALALGLLALAVFLARGRRRETLLEAGGVLIVAGLARPHRPAGRRPAGRRQPRRDGRRQAGGGARVRDLHRPPARRRPGDGHPGRADRPGGVAGRPAAARRRRPPAPRPVPARAPGPGLRRRRRGVGPHRRLGPAAGDPVADPRPRDGRPLDGRPGGPAPADRRRVPARALRAPRPPPQGRPRPGRPGRRGRPPTGPR